MQIVIFEISQNEIREFHSFPLDPDKQNKWLIRQAYERMTKLVEGIGVDPDVIPFEDELIYNGNFVVNGRNKSVQWLNIP